MIVAPIVENNWLSFYHPRPNSDLRLFSFPYSGAGASIYCPWRNLLPDNIELCAIQLPGRETRISERPFTHMPALVDAVVDVIRPFLQKPFAFFGHSMGALISFEVARVLQREYGQTAVHLFVSGHGAPHLPRRRKPIHRLAEPHFIAKVQQLNGTPAAIWSDAELRRLLISVLRADFSLCETYQYEEDAPLNCPITALGGLADPHVTREELTAWQQLTAHRFKCRMLPGDHFYLQAQRPLLLRVLCQDLLQGERLPSHL